MALGPDPTPSGRTSKSRPAARARTVVTAGSFGALVGLTAGLALDGGSSGAATGATSQQALPSPPPAVTEVEDRNDDSWWERAAGRVVERLGDDEHEDDSWWERAGERFVEELGDDDDDDEWRAPAPREQVPRSGDGGWSSSTPPQPAPQTRSSGS